MRGRGCVCAVGENLKGRDAARAAGRQTEFPANRALAAAQHPAESCMRPQQRQGAAPPARCGALRLLLHPYQSSGSSARRARCPRTHHAGCRGVGGSGALCASFLHGRGAHAMHLCQTLLALQHSGGARSSNGQFEKRHKKQERAVHKAVTTSSKSGTRSGTRSRWAAGRRLVRLGAGCVSLDGLCSEQQPA